MRECVGLFVSCISSVAMLARDRMRGVPCHIRDGKLDSRMRHGGRSVPHMAIGSYTVGCSRPYEIDGFFLVNKSRRYRIRIPVTVEDACVILDGLEIEIFSFVPCLCLLESAPVFLSRMCPAVRGII